MPAPWEMQWDTSAEPAPPPAVVNSPPWERDWSSGEQQPKKFGLGDTWPAKIAKGIYSGVTLPGDVYAGRVDPSSDEAIKRSTELATVATPVGVATRSGVGWAGVPKTPGEGQQVTTAAANIGVDVPRAAASDSMVVQRAGQALSNVPFGGSSLRKAGETATTQLGEATERAAMMPSGAAVIPEQAGATARASLENYIGPVTSERADKLYGVVDRMVNPDVKVPLPATTKIAQEIITRRGNAAQTGEGGAVKEITEALSRPDGLNYQGIKDLRTSIGEKLKGGLLPADISQGELKKIYGGLSDDLANAVKVAGGDKAAAAFERANKYYSLVSDRRENLSRLLNAKSDEALFSRLSTLAGSTASADVRLLAQARKSIPQEEWADISSAVIGKLGRDTAGKFSPSLWLGKQGYGGLSERGKEILFNSLPDGKRLRGFLDDISKVSERAKSWQRFANPSGTAQNVIGFGQVASLIAEPLTAMAGIIGAGSVSHVLSRSATAASAAQWSRSYELFSLRPGPSTYSKLNIASRNLAHTLSDKLGLNVSPADFMRAMQGPARAPAGKEQP